MKYLFLSMYAVIVVFAAGTYYQKNDIEKKLQKIIEVQDRILKKD